MGCDKKARLKQPEKRVSGKVAGGKKTDVTKSKEKVPLMTKGKQW